RLASRYSSNHSSSDHFSSDHSLSDHPSSDFSFSPEDTSSNTPVIISEKPSHLPVTHSPTSSLFVEPSRKRCRSPATLVPSTTPTPGALSPVRADLLPPCKRIRSSSVASFIEDNIEGSMEIGSKEEDIDFKVMV
ncbi:hypothetical protein Tco_0463293, partial [Tanacetum coccineum]